MAEDILVKHLLTSEMIEAGERLIRILDRSGSDINAALWLQDDDGTWQLVVSSPKTDDQGPREVYRDVLNGLNVMQSDGSTLLNIQDVTVTSPRSTLIKDLSDVVSTEKDDLARERITENRMGTSYINDALIYRLNKDLTQRERDVT